MVLRWCLTWTDFLFITVLKLGACMFCKLTLFLLPLRPGWTLTISLFPIHLVSRMWTESDWNVWKNCASSTNPQSVIVTVWTRMYIPEGFSGLISEPCSFSRGRRTPSPRRIPRRVFSWRPVPYYRPGGHVGHLM